MKKLLELVLENIEIVKYYNTGMCFVVHELLENEKIKYDESKKLINLIHREMKKRKRLYFASTPNKLSKFNPDENSVDSFFLFPIGEVEPRIKWLKKMIEKYK